jgi:hypothetical protein
MATLQQMLEMGRTAQRQQGGGIFAEQLPIDTLLPILTTFFGSSLTEAQQARPASSTPAALQASLAAIRTVGDGDIVYANDHNSVKNFLVMLISYLGDQVLTQDQTLSFAPALLQLGATGWTLAEGEADQGNHAAVSGWMPIELPDGVKIQSLSVHGTATSGQNVGTIAVALKRRPLQSTAAAEEIVSVSLAGQNPTFGVAKSAPQSDRQTVDRFSYGYYIKADVTGAATGAGIRLFGFEVACTRW